MTITAKQQIQQTEVYLRIKRMVINMITVGHVSEAALFLVDNCDADYQSCVLDGIEDSIGQAEFKDFSELVSTLME